VSTGSTPTSRAGSGEARIAPWLTVRDGAAAVAFYQAAFGATERYRLPGDGGRVVVAQLAVGGAEFWVQEDAAAGPGTPGGAARLIVTVADPDALFARALAAGAAAVFPVGEAHGWRLGRLADPFGHHWEIGRPLPAPG
jgi:PhnB protein